LLYVNPIAMSRLPKLEVASAGKSPSSIDAEVVAVFHDGSKKVLAPKGAAAALVSRLKKDDAFSARSGAIEVLRFAGSKDADAVLVGLGAAAELTEEKARVAGGNAWARLKAQRSKSVLVHADSLFQTKGMKTELSHSKIVRAFAEGLMLNAYQWDKYKSKSSDDKYFGPERLIFETSENALRQTLVREFAQVEAIGEAVTVTRDWSNEPSNIGTPEFYANEARKLAREYGLKCKVLNEREAAREKMGLFLSVSAGSDRPPRVVIVEYTPKKAKSAKTIALVGKGVTFDSGGISIKPSMRMEEMKHDMTGAATVMGATILASLWEVPNRIVTVMVFTENMPNGIATQPGNVIRARSGKTVEVINTDAEGRLILADALDLAQDYKPDVMIDAATLTGAVSVALGKYCCGVLGNDDGLIDSLRRAGDLVGERMWQLPLWDEYFDDMKSDTADMKNSCNDANGGTIRGAIFLKQFVRKGMPWAHLDIASTANGVGHIAYMPKKGATGSYVRTLARFAAEL
jgi:leucyl aminopeptidase